MSNVLVIHPDDRSTDFLKLVYKNEKFDVIHNCFISREDLVKEIENHDKIIMLGHGTPYGLLNPKTYGYLIDDSFANLLSKKETISMWCYSDKYFERNNIGSGEFHSGMIISEVAEELMMLHNIQLSKLELLDNMNLLAKSFGEVINETPEKIREHILEKYNNDDLVTKFNRKNIKVL